MIVPDVGGGFGVKGHVYPEEILVPAVARRLGRPVKWVETRSEHFLTAAGGSRPGPRGADRAASATAHRGPRDRLHARSRRLAHARRGHHAEHHQSPARPLSGAALSRPSGANVSPTRRSPPRIAAPGVPRPPSSSIGCSTARRGALGMDPAALRRLNLIRPDEMPYRDRPHLPRRRADHLRSGGLPGRLRPAARARSTTRAGAPSRRSAAGARGPSASGSAPTSRAPASGPSRAPTCAWIPTAPCSCTSASARRARGTRPRSPRSAPTSWRCPLESVVVVGGDTSLVGYGMGTIASRVAAVAGPAVQRSAARGRATRRGSWPPSSSSARRRTSCSPTGACTSAASPARA